MLFNIIALVLAVTLHEFSHAWVATRLGDPTPHVHGRVSLNPMRHIDPLGSIFLPLFLYWINAPIFGWAKPVPFNPHNLRKPTRDSALIAFAGPAMNILTAVFCAIPLKYLHSSNFDGTLIHTFIDNLFHISITIFAFNILPFPPFDGSKVIGIFVPRRYRHQYERYLENGVTWVLIFIVFDQMIVKYITGISLLSYVVGTISTWILALVGLGS